MQPPNTPDGFATGIHQIEPAKERVWADLGVGMYPHEHSPYGLLDLSGNVWEWCLNEYEKPKRIQESGSEMRVLRGGGWDFNQNYAAAVYRLRFNPYDRYYNFGFRVALSGLSLPPLPSDPHHPLAVDGKVGN